MVYKVIRILGLYRRIYSVKKYWEIFLRDLDRLYHRHVIGTTFSFCLKTLNQNFDVSLLLALL
jgi:hypothetical protein